MSQSGSKASLFIILKLTDNSSRLNKGIMTVLVFGHLILISIDFYYFISQFSPLYALHKAGWYVLSLVV